MTPDFRAKAPPAAALCVCARETHTHTLCVRHTRTHTDTAWHTHTHTMCAWHADMYVRVCACVVFVWDRARSLWRRKPSKNLCVCVTHVKQTQSQPKIKNYPSRAAVALFEPRIGKNDSYGPN